MGNLKKKLKHYTPALGWGILIGYFSLMPSNELPGFLLDAKDILLHFLIYFFFTMLLFFGANGYTNKFLHNSSLSVIIAVSAAFGLGIEIIQENFISGRHFEWGDILFNILGTLVILPINHILKRR